MSRWERWPWGAFLILFGVAAAGFLGYVFLVALPPETSDWIAMALSAAIPIVAGICVICLGISIIRDDRAG